MTPPDTIYVTAQWHCDTKVPTYHASAEKTSHPHEELYIRKELYDELKDRLDAYYERLRTENYVLQYPDDYERGVVDGRNGLRAELIGIVQV